jgi:hypothetical protein
MNRNGKLVYTYEDIKKLEPKSGLKGLWCFQTNFHSGHKKCAEAVQHCDWVVGIIFNKRAEEEKWMAGVTNLKDTPLHASDIEQLKNYSDVGLILTGDYHPYRKYWKEIKREFNENFPIECLREKGILDDRNSYNGLLHGVAFRYIIHGVYNLYFHHQAQGGKDRFRVVGYREYVYDRWGVKIDIIDPELDEVGNSISQTINGLPKNLKDRINKKLIQPYFKSIEEVRENVKDIEGLQVINFYRTDGWIHSTFQFKGYKPWTEGVRWK